MKLALQLILLVATAVATSFLLSLRLRMPPVELREITPLEVRDLRTPSFPEPPAEELEKIPPPAATKSPPPLPKPILAPPPPAPIVPKPQEINVNVVQFIPALSDQEFYKKNAGAVIQIFCSTPFQLFGATGVIVNEHGLVLSNAHVAEVISNVGAEHCVARHGSPADNFAGIEVVFKANTTAKIGDTKVPQRDVAFLRLTNPTVPFQAADISLHELDSGNELFTLGYPSEFLQGLTATNNAALIFSSLIIAEVADLDGDPKNVEVYIFQGGLALQQGSSGTAIFTRDGKITGIIFATTKTTSTADREGIALTAPYIDRIMKSETGQNLAEFITTH